MTVIIGIKRNVIKYVIKGDVGIDMDRIRQQEITQERHAHRLALEIVDDVFAHVAGADAVIDRIVIPARILKQPRKRGLADARHAEYGHGPLRPIPEIFA